MNSTKKIEVKSIYTKITENISSFYSLLIEVLNNFENCSFVPKNPIPATATKEEVSKLKETTDTLLNSFISILKRPNDTVLDSFIEKNKISEKHVEFYQSVIESLRNILSKHEAIPDDFLKTFNTQYAKLNSKQEPIEADELKKQFTDFIEFLLAVSKMINLIKVIHDANALRSIKEQIDIAQNSLKITQEETQSLQDLARLADESIKRQLDQQTFILKLEQRQQPIITDAKKLTEEIVLFAKKVSEYKELCNRKVKSFAEKIIRELKKKDEHTYSTLKKLADEAAQMELIITKDIPEFKEEQKQKLVVLQNRYLEFLSQCSTLPSGTDFECFFYNTEILAVFLVLDSLKVQVERTQAKNKVSLEEKKDNLKAQCQTTVKAYQDCQLGAALDYQRVHPAIDDLVSSTNKDKLPADATYAAEAFTEKLNNLRKLSQDLISELELLAKSDPRLAVLTQLTEHCSTIEQIEINIDSSSKALISEIDIVKANLTKLIDEKRDELILHAKLLQAQLETVRGDINQLGSLMPIAEQTANGHVKKPVGKKGAAKKQKTKKKETLIDILSSVMTTSRNQISTELAKFEEKFAAIREIENKLQNMKNHRFYWLDLWASIPEFDTTTFETLKKRYDALDKKVKTLLEGLESLTENELKERQAAVQKEFEVLDKLDKDVTEFEKQVENLRNKTEVENQQKHKVECENLSKEIKFLCEHIEKIFVETKNHNLSVLRNEFDELIRGLNENGELTNKDTLESYKNKLVLFKIKLELQLEEKTEKAEYEDELSTEPQSSSNISSRGEDLSPLQQVEERDRKPSTSFNAQENSSDGGQPPKENFSLSEIDLKEEESVKSRWQKFKDFWSAHWKKILVCALIGAILVVAGVFTGGLVPLIAGSLGISVGAAAVIGFGGAAVTGILLGGGAGAIAGAVPSKEKPGVKSFLSRHKWSILAAVVILTVVAGCILTGGILAGVVAVGGVVGTGLAICGGITTGIAGGVAASTTAIAGVTLSATAATAIGATAATTGVVAAGCTTGCILGAISDNNRKEKIGLDKDPSIEPVVITPSANSKKSNSFGPSSLFSKFRQCLARNKSVKNEQTVSQQP